jgi:hypothetical protein
MSSYLIYGDNEEIVGKIILPSHENGYTDMEIKQKFFKRYKDNKIIDVWVKFGINETVVKVNTYTLIKTILTACCQKCGISGDKYDLKHGNTILPQDKQIGFFADNNDIIHLVPKE